MWNFKPKLPEYWIPQDLKTVLLNNAQSYNEMTERSKEFFSILQKLNSVDHLVLAECHYLQFLKLALYLEEFQCNSDLRKFNMYGKKIEKLFARSNLFKIPVKDMEKDHPLQKNCNLIELVNCKDVCKTKFILRVKEILDDHIIAIAYPEFYNGHSSDNVYNVRFRYNNFPFRCGHFALSLINGRNMSPYLFPTGNKETQESPLPYTENTWHNKAISSNPEQKQAVINIISKISYPAPYILYGPPGTGKTATLVEAVCQIYHETQDYILICAPSNAAADVVTKRLLNYIPSSAIARMYSQSRDLSLIDAEIKLCSNCAVNRLLRISEKMLSFKRVVICTLVTCTRLLLLDIRNKFSYVFIDEAGQSTEPESLIAFNAMIRHGSHKCQIVLSGDPQQLGPGIRSKYAMPILGQSMLERLMKSDLYSKGNQYCEAKYNPHYITKLLRNYRSHSAIIRVSNELYYDNELIACSDEQSFVAKEFPAGFPVLFHNIQGKEEKDNNSTSSYNHAEIKKVVEYVRLLVGQKIGEKVIQTNDIGIVTPFALQSSYLQKTLKQENMENVTVGTVEIFQGQEKEVIIMSTVRSKVFVQNDQEHIGFLSNPRRFNVALTRAKSVLVVIGNPCALQIDTNWRYFLKFCHENYACRGLHFQLAEKLDETLDVKLQKRSIDLFSELLKILQIDDGIIRQMKEIDPFSTNAMHSDNQNCAVL